MVVHTAFRVVNRNQLALAVVGAVMLYYSGGDGRRVDVFQILLRIPPFTHKKPSENFSDGFSRHFRVSPYFLSIY